MCLKMLAKPHCTQSGFADHYPYPVFKWLAIIGKINPTFSDKPIYCHFRMGFYYGNGINQLNQQSVVGIATSSQTRSTLHIMVIQCMYPVCRGLYVRYIVYTPHPPVGWVGAR